MAHVEDPYFSVRDEVKKTLAGAKQLYERWQLLCRRGGATTASGENEMSWVTGELKNALRSIEWDLEDLEETLGIVEKNPRKFRLDVDEVQSRRQFVETSRRFVKEVTAQLDNAAASAAPPSSMRYSAAGEPPSPERDNDEFIDSVHQQQQQIVRQQDEQLETINSGISVLKGMSTQIGRELDSQAVMLDEFSHEMEHTESRLDTTMKKIARVMHMSNDRRQWIAIFVLLILLFIVIVLLIVL